MANGRPNLAMRLTGDQLDQGAGQGTGVPTPTPKPCSMLTLFAQFRSN
jgi:hypothetical protein